MSPETISDALVKSNDVARYFLGTLFHDITPSYALIVFPALGQANAAQSLLETLPQGIANPSDDEMTGEDDDAQYHRLEHESFRKLFGVLFCHEQVMEVLAREPKTT